MTATAAAHSTWRSLLFCVAQGGTLGPASAQDDSGPRPIPSFRELEAARAVIGEIRIDNQNIFDLSDSRENNAFYRGANFLHIRTRPEVVRQTLLFKSGDPVSVQAIDESERLLRTGGNSYDVSIRPVAVRDGVVDIAVTTRDTWTLHPGLSFGRQGGANSGGVTLKEQNLMGAGIVSAQAVGGQVERIAHPERIIDLVLGGEAERIAQPVHRPEPDALTQQEVCVQVHR